MVARFTKDKYGWRCTKVGSYEMLYPVVRSLIHANVLYVNVSRAPRLGFSKRPHHYI
jgi:hypothetical protein